MQTVGMKDTGEGLTFLQVSTGRRGGPVPELEPGALQTKTFIGVCIPYLLSSVLCSGLYTKQQ